MKSLALQIYTRTGVSKENLFPDKKILHIGCGNSKLKGAVGVDVLKFPAVDVVHDLDLLPWPFKDESIDIFFAHSVVICLKSEIDFFNEVWRIGKNGSRIIISVPYFRTVDAFSDPTAKHFYTSFSMDYFCDMDSHLSKYEYSEHKFKKVGFWYGWSQPSWNPLVRAFKSFIHAYSRLYDQYLSLLFPVKIVTWELEIRK